MNKMKVIGICLIILGVVALFYQGMTFVVPKDIIDFKGFTLTVDENKTIPLPPIVGGVSLAAGIVVVMLSGKGK